MKYYSVLDYSQVEHIVEKSRFISYTKPVYNEGEAIDFVTNIKKLNYNASHNVNAYVIGEASDIKRFSDDGEPSGTAGMPVLDVILKKRITNICIVVTRYFGGIKLGTGGLVRAYRESAKIGINASKIIECKKMKCYSIICTYDISPKIQHKFKNSNVIVKHIEYLENVTFLVYINEKDTIILKELVDITSSLVKINELENIFVRFFNDKMID